ncbi:Gfo/Idh/MocA family protein [Brevibacillus sp. MS2.2]|uniref:Gfo/Idh/MocA family protein n=1 Tax=Brevibacillus sp. MS2.2 TaxID=2738981 RepID=UPI00156AF024|nr:Gfo/Idh/MocA family oxidoreductase [Brevibacillus sp. MS2.2]NRR23241.1 Gfo/Idh/MocA family oxidoreductase [Brevibacillus sp. MS2.2]
MEKVIVVGAGHWGINHVKTFYELGALAGVVETNVSSHVELIKAYPGVSIFSSLEEGLAVEANGVVIATPASTHYTLAAQAMLAGKDVLVEKPMTLSMKEAESLVEVAKNTDRILMVGHLLLYQPAIQKMKELLDQNAIGKVCSIHQERMKLGRVRSVENVLWSFGVHDIAVLLYLIGKEPVSIQVNGQSIVQPTVEDDTHLHLNFANGIQAHLRTSWLWPIQKRSMVITGTEGFLVYEEDKQIVTLYKKGVGSDLQNWSTGEEIVYQGGTENPLKNECEHFLACIQSRALPLSNGMNGMEVVRILEQASRLLEKEENGIERRVLQA